ncbi:hypothetical protein TNCV_2843541 [Trichonephila clavipes]|nr:hypothetical protein TNCV_2843541 [Trichonephila clavipes]
MQIQHDATVHQLRSLGYGDEPVARQPWIRHFLLPKDLANVLARAAAEHFSNQGRSLQYRLHVVVHYPAET